LKGLLVSQDVQGYTGAFPSRKIVRRVLNRWLVLRYTVTCSRSYRS